MRLLIPQQPRDLEIVYWKSIENINSSKASRKDTYAIREKLLAQDLQ